MRHPGLLLLVPAFLLVGGCGPGTGTDPALNRPPVADFTFDQSNLGIPNTVRFDASRSSDSDGYILAYNWDFGDGTTATGVQTIHVYPAAAEYTVTLVVTDNGYATGTRQRIVSTRYPLGTAKWGYQFPSGASVAGALPAIGADGTIYVSAAQSVVAQQFNAWRLNAVASDGTLRWSYEFPGGSANIITQPTYSRSTDTVYVGFVDVSQRIGRIYALSSAGQVKWSYQLPTFTSGVPTTLALAYSRIGLVDSVFFGTVADATSGTRARVYRLDWTAPPGSGTQSGGTGQFTYVAPAQAAWAIESDTPVLGLVLGTSGAVYVATVANIAALNSNGTLAWTAAADGGQPTGALALGADETVFAAYTNPPRLVAFGRDPNGNVGVRWSAAATGEIGAPVVGLTAGSTPGGGVIPGQGGTTVQPGSGGLVLYTAATGTGLVAVDPNTGTTAWTSSLISGAGPITLLDDGTVLARGLLGLFAFSTATNGSGGTGGSAGTTLSQLWTFTSAANFGAAAIASDGTIYVVGGPVGFTAVSPAQTSVLYAVQGPAQLANAPWPAPRHDSANTGWAGGP